jgi:hypothetical protein
MRERGEAESKAYMEKMLATWKAYREGVATRREAIHDKIVKLRADCPKLDADLKKRKADMLKAYEEKRMTERKVDPERTKAERKAYEEKMMTEPKSDQEKREAESKAHQEDLQKMMNAKINAEADAIRARTKSRQEETLTRMQENTQAMREEIKYGQAEIRSTICAFSH